MSEKRIVRRSLAEIKASRGRDQTDWERLRNMTDEEIERAIADDPDADIGLDADWSDADIIVPGPKKPISIRLDEDIIEYFKSLGSGYQTRINTVLRRYMTHQQNKRKKEKETV